MAYRPRIKPRRCRLRRLVCVVGLVALLGFVRMSHALCTTTVPRAFETVASEYNIPSDVYYAIALQESGRMTEQYGFSVWPWALNIDNTPHYPDSYERAVELIETSLATGSEGIAVGLMQVYWKYHKQRFDGNPYYALDIATNLRLGAQIFSEAMAHHSGDVWQAVGFYYAGVITSKHERQDTEQYVAGVKQKLHHYVRGDCDEVHLVQQP